MVATREAARIRDDLESFVLARRIAAAAGLELLRWAPVPLSHPLETSRAGELTLLTAFALLSDAALSSAAVLLLILAAVVLRAERLRVAPSRLVPVVACLFILPVFYAPVRRFAPAIPWIPSSNAVIWLSLCALLAGMTLVAARRFSVAGSALAFASALAGCALVVAGMVAHLGTRGPRVDLGDGRRDRLPNILLVSIDSLRADHVGCYGYARPTTPTLDRLAAEGTRFAQAAAPTSWTLPSHLALLTALPAESPRGNPAGLRAGLSVVTLAEVLRSAGYETAGFVGGPYLESRYGFAQGFSVYDDFTVVAGSNPKSHRGITSPELLRLAADWLEAWRRSRSERPFFVFWHLWDVHFDYTPPAPYDRMFDPDYEGTIDGRNFLGNRAIHRGMNPRDLQHVMALYDGEIAFTDAHIGMLLERLEAWGVLEETLIVVTSDHGDEFFEHGVKGHRKNLYETTLAVPLILRWPGRVAAGRVVQPQVGLLDVAPTILSVIGIDPPAAFGRVPLLDEPAARDLSPLLVETDPASRETWTRRPLFADLHGEMGAVRTARWKLVARFDPAGAENAVELYDLDADAAETRDLAAERKDERSELLDRLRQWRRQLRGDVLAADVPVDPEHRERLRSLGYVD